MKKLLLISLAIFTLTACTVPLRHIPAAVSAPVPIGKVAQYMTVCDSGGLNVRDGAGIEYHIIGGLQDGDEVEVIRHARDAFGQSWGMIDGGWVNERYLCAE
jgi:uncharacterized protein YgiM (DUF1202 family)